MEREATREPEPQVEATDWAGLIAGAGVMLAGLLNLMLMPVYGFLALLTDKLGEPHFWWQSWSFPACGVASLVCWLAAQVSVEQPSWRWPRWVTTCAAAVWLGAALPWLALAILATASGAGARPVLWAMIPTAAVCLSLAGAWLNADGQSAVASPLGKATCCDASSGT